MLEQSNSKPNSTIGALQQQPCPLCDSDKHGILHRYSYNHWKIAKCIDCNFVYLRNPVDYDAMVDEYSWEKTSLAETNRRLTSRPFSAKLSRWSRWRLSTFGRSFDKVAKHMPAGRVLNIGCGAGSMNVGDDAIPYGIEISRSLHKVADALMREKNGYAIHAPATQGAKQFDDNFFDGVIMFSYLEHEQNPREIIKQVSRILKKNGVAYVRVPNFDSINRKVVQKNWCGFRYPDHVNYFTYKTLKKLSDNFGFNIRVLNLATLPFDDNINALLTKR